VSRKSATSLKVWWSKVAGAKSYKVYRLVEGKWKVVKRTSSLSWVEKKLPKRKVQQYRVAACAKAKGKAPCGPKSTAVSAITYTAKDETVNVKSIKFDSLPKSLSVYDEWEFIAYLVPAQNGEKKNPVPVSMSARVVSSDPSVVSVSSTLSSFSNNRWGQLVAKKLGFAVITMTAHNGVSASFRVNVVDSSCPVDPESWGPEEYSYVAPLLASHSDQICALNQYVMTHPVGDGVATIDELGQVVVEKGDPQLDATGWGMTQSILSFDWPHRTEIEFRQHSISVRLYLNDVPWLGVGSLRVLIAYSPYRYYPNAGPVKVKHWLNRIEQGSDVDDCGGWDQGWG
jgi:hypothetical protein